MQWRCAIATRITHVEYLYRKWLTLKEHHGEWLYASTMKTVTVFVILILVSVSSSPWRIVDDAGAAFAMGAIGGSIFSYWKGYKNSPPVSSSLALWLRRVWQ